MNLTIGNQQIAKPILMLDEGQKGTLSEVHNGRKIKFEIVAKEGLIKFQPAINIKFKIKHTLATGGNEIQSTAELVTVENRKSQIIFENSTDHKKIILSVIAFRE